MTRGNLTTALSEQAARLPTRLALIHKGQEYDFAWLDRAVWRMAAGLAAGGVTPGRVCGLLFASPMDLLLSQLAVARLGATLVHLTLLQTETYQRDLLVRAGAALLLTDAEAPRGLAAVATPLRLPDSLDPPSGPGPEPPIDSALLDPTPQAPWMLLLGSGSTGSSKLLPLSHAAALGRGEIYGNAYGWEPSDRLACLTPLEMGFGAIRTAMALCRGGSVVLLDPHQRPDPEGLRRQGVTFLLGGVSHAEQLLNAAAPGDPDGLPFLRVLLLGGSTVTDTLRRRIAKQLTPNLYVNYGCQECGPITMTRPDEPTLPGSVGRPIEGTDLRIVDAAGQQVPPGESGLIQVRSPGMIDGYRDDPEETARSFQDGWFSPGDVGLIAADGQLILHGRADHMMIFDGLNIYPTEVENVMAAFPGIGDVACVPLRSDTHQDVPLCVVSFGIGRVPALSELHRFALDRLGPRRPRQFIVLPSIPRAITGKLIRRRLYEEIEKLMPGESGHGGGQPPRAWNVDRGEHFAAQFRGLSNKPNLRPVRGFPPSTPMGPASVDPLPFTTVAELLLGNATLLGGTEALFDPEGPVISHADLASIAGAIGDHLERAGIDHRDRVALVLPPGPELAAALLGTMAHTAVAPLNPAASLAAFRSDLERLRVALVLVDDAPPPALLAAAAEGGLRCLPITVAICSASARSREPIRLVADPGDLALLLQTSGTTAQPKVVPLSHTNLIASAQNVAGLLRLGIADRSLSVMPLFHIHGIVASLLAPLLSGGSVICCRHNHGPQLLELLQRLEPTWLSGVPTFLQHLLQAHVDAPGPTAAHRLRLIRSSSASLPPTLLAGLEAAFGVPVIEAYGMTEAAHQICSNRLPPAERPIGSVGAAAGPEVAVLGPDLRPVPSGEPGEVAIRGTNVTSGYEASSGGGWRTGADGERWFPTGDEGVLDGEGRLQLTGRLKEMINRGGEKVIPRLLDEALLTHPAVKQAVAFALPHPSLGEDVAAAVVLAPDSKITEAELRQHCFSCLVPHQVPSRILLLSDLPKGPTGKPQRIGLADRLSHDLLPSDEPPEGELESLISATFAEVLKSSNPGRHQNFFLLGGDSLSGQRVISRLEIHLFLTLPVTLLFRYPTACLLARELDQRLDQAISFLEAQEAP